MKHKMKICRGKNCKLFCDNLFDAEWKELGETSIEKDPFHNQKIEFKWYEVTTGETVCKFGYAEIAPEQYMFLYD